MTALEHDPFLETIGDWRHLALGDVGSTNAECLARARAGDPGHLWITADRQLDGRGRRGRHWVSEPGNLYASLLLCEPGPLHALGSLPLAVAVAVHRAIEHVLPPDRADALKIKWPNDLLLGAAKVCGILMESETLPGGRQVVVIGCGINIAHAPDSGLYPTTHLNAHGAATTPDLLFPHLLQAMEVELRVWNGGAGVAETLRAWKSRSAGTGELATVTLPDRTLVGRVRGIDAQGRLMLHSDDGSSFAIAAGDVFFTP